MVENGFLPELVKTGGNRECRGEGGTGGTMNLELPLFVGSGLQVGKSSRGTFPIISIHQKPRLETDPAFEKKDG